MEELAEDEERWRVGRRQVGQITRQLMVVVGDEVGKLGKSGLRLRSNAIGLVVDLEKEGGREGD